MAAVGATGQGLQLVTSLAVNPGTIATGETDSRSVWLSRFADLSIVLPANLDPADGLKKGFSYIGGRLRINVAAAIGAAGLVKARNVAEAKYTTVAVAVSKAIPAIGSLIAASSDPGQCARAIEEDDQAREKENCGGGTFDASEVTDTTKEARKALADFRAEADRRYLSVEARFDRGDLNADGAGAKDTLLAQYVAAGYTFGAQAEGASFGIRGRGGAVFFQDGMSKTSKTAGFVALGVELAIARDLRRYALTAGIELYSKQATMTSMTNPMLALDELNSFKLGVSLPVADGKTLSVGVTLPTDGGDPIIAVSGDWSLLLEAVK